MMKSPFDDCLFSGGDVMKMVVLVLVIGMMLGITAVNAQIIETQRLISDDLATEDYFGNGMAVSGDYAIIGACYDDDNGSNSGSAYIFYNNAGTWEQQQKINASDGQSNEFFALTVAISGDYAIAASLGANSYGGKAYVFHNDAGVWTETQILTASDPENYKLFGCSINMENDFAIIGAYGDEASGVNSGSAYVFQNVSNNWIEVAKLTASDADENDFFGTAVAIQSDFAVVGADGNENNAGSQSGTAYIFYNNSGTWQQSQILESSDSVVGDHFGASVSISGDRIAIGANYKSDNGVWSGAAYIFENVSETWEQQQKITASDAGPSKHFGNAIKIEDDTVVVGADGNISFTPYNAGSAYIFKANSDGIWDEKARFLASDLGVRDQYGYVVDFSNNFAFVGSPRTDSDFSDGGAVYTYEVVITNIISQPVSPEVGLLEDAVFNVEAEGINLSYQWRKDGFNLGDGGNISGSTTDQLTISSITNDDLGTYDCVVSGDYGAETSVGAVLSLVTGINGNVNNLFRLSVHPNPFNPLTSVSFSMDHPQYVELIIYDMTGKRITVLADGAFLAGDHSFAWQGKNMQGRAVSSGTYFVRMSSDDGVTSEKMILIR